MMPMAQQNLPIRSDVRQEPAVEECFERVSAELGVPDIRRRYHQHFVDS
jgi:hypothetical protein